MKEKLNTCAFTGHRPTKLPCGDDESHPICIEIKNAIRAQIVRLYLQRNVTQFLTGGAIGIDQWAAEEILSLKKTYPALSLTIVVPFRKQAECFTREQRERYESVLRHADHTVLLQEDYSDDCYFRRNDYLVEKADVLIAVYDRSILSRSGTGYTVRKAIATGTNIIFIDPKTKRISYSIGATNAYEK